MMGSRSALQRLVTVPLVAWALCFAPSPAAAQFGPPGGQPQPPPPTAEEERPREPAEPLPEPLVPEMEEARERAKEAGVLRGEKPRKGKVYEIRIEGSRKVEPDAVLVNVQTRIDRVPDQRIIQADVRRIYRMGLFSDVVVESHKGPKGSIKLVYRLVEKPAVVNVLFEGNQDVSKDDIKEVVDIKSFQVLDVRKVRANVRKIEKLYVDKGFFLAEVSYALRPSDGKKNDEEDDIGGIFDALTAPEPIASEEGTDPAVSEIEGEFVDVVFKITERSKVKVETITFVGNEAITTDELKKSLGTRENHPLGMLTEWGTYKEELAEVDPLLIEQLYQDRGYINVKVGQPRVQLSADKTRIALTFSITEGEQYSLRSFDVDGELLTEDAAEYERVRDEEPDRVIFLKEDVLGRTRIRGGEVFSRSKVAQDVMAVADRYRDKGYAYVNIIPETIVHDDDNTVDLTLKIQAGPRVTVERIEVTGNTKTQDRVIRRELRLYEGEYYSASQLRLSEQRVTALGFFESVDVTTKQGTQPDRMVVVLDVKEKPTGTFQVGFGFSNAEQFILQGQVAQNNFMGRGHTVSGSIQWSAFRNIVDVRFVDPYFLYIGQEPLTFAFTAFNTQRNFIDFLRNSTGGDVTLGYPVGRPLRFLTKSWLSDAGQGLRPYIPDFENFQLFLTAAGERVEIQEQSFDVRLQGLTANVPRYTSALRGSLIFDQRNNRIFPSAGWYLSSTAEFANPFLGSALAPPLETGMKDVLETGLDLKDNLGFLKAEGRPNDFTRLSFVGRAYYNFDQFLPLKGVVAKANLQLGLLLTDDPTLVFERYYLGGFNTIRGYPLRSISPVQRVGGLDVTNPLQEFRVGGDKQFFTNLELEFPIFEQVGIRGVLFFDMGNTYGPDENLFYLGNAPTPFLADRMCNGQRCFDPRNPMDLPLTMYSSVGFGVRWFSPIGPLRFEWGIPLNQRPAGTFGNPLGDQPIQFEFNIGPSF
jgi:outer membrane protein insertion porin family